MCEKNDPSKRRAGRRCWKEAIKTTLLDFGGFEWSIWNDYKSLRKFCQDFWSKKEGEKRSHLSSIDRLFWLKKLAAISVAYILLQYDNCASSIIGKYTCSWLVSCHAHLSLIIKRLLAKKMILKLHFLSLTNTVRHEDLQYLSNWHTSGQEWMDLSYQLSNNGP